MKYEDFEYSEFHCVQKQFILYIKGYETHVFGHIGYKVYGGWVAVESDSCETPVHETT